jgi:hypothetical protein
VLPKQVSNWITASRQLERAVPVASQEVIVNRTIGATLHGTEQV